MAILVAVAMSLGSIITTTAKGTSAGPLRISHAWARPTLGNVKLSAAYLMIRNEGKQDDTLLSVSTDIAKRAELHETVRQGDIAKMLPVKGGVVIPKGGMAQFKPLGKHIMLMGLSKKLKPGDTFPLTLVFKKQGKVVVEVKVKEATQNKNAKEMKGSHHGSL